MLDRLGDLYSKTLLNNNSLYDAYDKNELNEEILNINLYRENFFSLLVILLDIALAFIDILYLFPSWGENRAYKSIFYSHIIVLIVLSLLLCICYFLKKYRPSFFYKSRKYFFYTMLVFLLYWCVFLALNAQFIHGQISAYTICILSISTVIIMDFRERLLIFLPAQLILILGITIIQKDGIKLSGSIINSTFLFVLAFFISRMNYKYYVNGFLYRKDLVSKTSELNDMNSGLERLVNERTCELIVANQKIISEMETRHKTEMEAAEAKRVFEKKEREFDKAIEMEKLRTELFTNISHEFKTPLNVVLSAEQLLEHKLKNIPDQEIYNQVSRHTGLIRQNCFRLIRLVSNLLDMNKIELGYLELNLKNYDIVKVVEDIVLSVAEFVQSKDIELVFDTFVEEKIIACDADKIERVILNMLSNAVKFTPCNGLILVSLKLEEGEVVISVKDTGTGIPTDKLSKIFDRYVQVENSLVRNSEGSGIGLSLVKSIIELHDGSVSVKSSCGTGSEFIIRLPDRVVPGGAVLDNSKGSIHDKKIDKINVEFSDIYL